MDKKNTIFLTVIAIATLLVAVVGATFAYFTAQSNGSANTPVNVKTETTNSTTIKTTGKIGILADQFNFADKTQTQDNFVGSQKGASSATISFTASSGATSDQKYCYTVELAIEKNGFLYPTLLEHTEDPQLVFSISKSRNNQKTGGITEENDNGASYVEYGDDSANNISDIEKGYNSSVLTDATVCNNTYDHENPEEGKESHYVNGCESNQTIKGFDITTLGSSASKENPTKIKIPKLTTDTSAGDSVSNNEYVHVITAGKDTTIIDFWKASVIFVNYGYDQQINTEKEFAASLNFTPVDCTTGQPAPSAS